MVKKLTSILIFLLFIASVSYSIELDSDGNNYLDTSKGGFNLNPETNPSGARTLLVVPSVTDLTNHTGNISNPHTVTKTQVGLSYVENIKVNLTAIINPPVTADSSIGYSIGSKWVNTTSKIVWECVDATVNNAIWKEITIQQLSSSEIKTLYELNADTNVFTDAEKTKLFAIEENANNYTHPANHAPSIITQDANNRFVTDTEKSTWSAKQAALGFTPEDVSNKRTTFQITPDDVHYPSEKLVKDSLDGKEPADATIIKESELAALESDPTVPGAISTHAGEADPHTGYARESTLGNSAGLDIGITEGTVAAGDDGRFDPLGVSVKTAGAVGDGGTDDTSAFQALVSAGATINLPPGIYYLASSVVIPGNGKLILRGASRDSVIIRAAHGVTAFVTANAYPGATFAKTIDVSGVTFDGERVRGTFPYMSFATDSYGMLTAIQAVAQPGDPDSRFRISDCRFKDMPNLPFLIDHFNNVQVDNSIFYKTRDPGFRFCNKVTWAHNITEFGSDNGVSISRGCRIVAVTGSLFKDCESNGIWVAGFNLALSGTATATGSTYNAGDTVTLTALATTFSSSFLDNLITLTSGSDEATFKVISIASGTAATAICVTATPVSLQNTPATWYAAPATGVSQFTVTGNTVVGGYSSNITAADGGRNGLIANNTLVRSGWTADSEISTTGSIITGSTTLTVADVTGLAINDFVIVESKTSFGQYFVSKITNIAGTTITLSSAPTETFIQESVRKVHLNTESAQIRVAGSVVGPDVAGERVLVANNLMIDPSRFGVQLGSSANGTATDIAVRGNQMFTPPSVSTASAASRHGVQVSESTGIPLKNIIVETNYYEGAGMLVNLSQRGASLKTGIRIKDNVAPNTTGQINATDLDNGGAIVSGYVATYQDTSGSTILPGVEFEGWTAVTPSAGVVTVNAPAVVYTPTGAGATITGFARKSGDNKIPLFVLRNGSGTYSITLTNNSSVLRTMTGADVVIPPYGGAVFTFVNGTITQHLGGGPTGAGATDHGSLTGLGDDDHVQYALADGSRGTFEEAGAVAGHESTHDHTKLHDPVTAGTGISLAGQQVTNSDTGSAAVTAHNAASDPHAGYMLESNIGTGANQYPAMGADGKFNLGTWSIDPAGGLLTSVSRALSRTATAWANGQSVQWGSIRANGGRVYVCGNAAGTTATGSEPTHSSACVTGADGVKWCYASTGAAFDLIGLYQDALEYRGPMRLYGQNNMQSYVSVFVGLNSPEGAAAATVGSMYLRMNPTDSSTVLYIKVTGTGNTGWKAIGDFSGNLTVGGTADLQGAVSNSTAANNGNVEYNDHIQFANTKGICDENNACADAANIKSASDTVAAAVTTSAGAGDSGKLAKLDSSGKFDASVLPSGSPTSGTYTPTLTNVGNISVSTPYTAQYMRVGNTVTVSGKVDMTVTSTTTTTLGISLPIASALTTEEQCAGTAFNQSVSGLGAGISADATNDRATLKWNSNTAGGVTMFYTYTYLVQ